MKRLPVVIVLGVLMAGCMSDPRAHQPEAGMADPLRDEGTNSEESAPESSPPEQETVDYFDLRNCTGATIGAEAPAPLFPHSPPPTWPGIAVHPPKIVVFAATCEEAIVGRAGYAAPFNFCWYMHTNISEKSGAWDEARYTTLAVPLGLIIEASPELALDQFFLLDPQRGAVNITIDHESPTSHLSATCSGPDGQVTVSSDNLAPSGSTTRLPPAVVRLVAEPEQPIWWSVNILREAFTSTPDNPFVAYAKSGEAQIHHTGVTPFKDWPLQSDNDVVNGDAMVTFKSEFRWYLNGTGLE